MLLLRRHMLVGNRLVHSDLSAIALVLGQHHWLHKLHRHGTLPGHKLLLLCEHLHVLHVLLLVQLLLLRRQILRLGRGHRRRHELIRRVHDVEVQRVLGVLMLSRYMLLIQCLATVRLRRRRRLRH